METLIDVDIARDRETVFDFTIERMEEWSSLVVSDEVVSETPEVIGTTFHTVVEDRGRRMQFDGEVIRHDRPREHSVVMKGEQFDMEVDYTFEESDGITKVKQFSRVEPKGGMKAFFFLFGWMMKRSGCDAAQKELENLKRILEGGSESSGMGLEEIHIG